MRGKFRCICGFVGNPSHTKNCNSFQAEFIRVTESLQNYITQCYLDNYSVSECVNIVIARENTQLPGGTVRKIIVCHLIKNGIYEGIGGKNQQEKKQKKVQATVKQRYGVINVGQLEGYGRKELNKIPYKKLSMMDEMSNYRKLVEDLTTRYVSSLKKKNLLPERCHYTDYKFNDVLLEKVNPNDPLKRTVDHVVPVSEAFFLGWPAEKTASADNIVFCLRCVNTVKSNTDAARFKKILVPLIKERLLHESQVS
jgi:hypothetical protein